MVEIRKIDLRKPASTLGGNGVGRKRRGKFSQIGEKGNVLTIKTLFEEGRKLRFFNHEWTPIDTNGKGFNAEAQRGRRNAKRAGGRDTNCTKGYEFEGDTMGYNSFG